MMEKIFLSLLCLTIPSTVAYAVRPLTFRHVRSASLCLLHASDATNMATTTTTTTTSSQGYTIRDSWALVSLGDLHLEDDMTQHEQARGDCVSALKELSLIPCPPKGVARDPSFDLTVDDMVQELEDARAGDLSAEQLEMLMSRKRDGELCHCYLVSLGDLGRKDIRHEPGDAGTTKSFDDAKTFLDGFGLPYELVSGNHDLEGLDEFDTDEANLQAWLDCFDKETPYFSRQIGEKTLLLGLSTVRFRNSPYSSHEVHVDDEQLDWFVKMVESHPANEGWKIIVYSHAPIMGSGLRVLQSVHVINGCAWLNHCSDNRNRFIQTVQANPQIKLWFSGHFHLSHDFEDSISTIGSCTFVQVGVIGPQSTRDGRRQTRIVQGSSDRMKIYSVNHHVRDDDDKAELRLDAEIDLLSDIVRMSPRSSHLDDTKDWFQAYVPQEEDGCYIESPDGHIADASSLESKVCWWHMADGKVLGLHQGQLVEYDSETLSPLGVVVNEKKLDGREVIVVQEGTALVLVNDETRDVEVIHPNDDGSYWRKFQRNKRVRLEEKAREEVAKRWLEETR